jgi:hypothetical protein
LQFTVSGVDSSNSVFRLFKNQPTSCGSVSVSDLVGEFTSGRRFNCLEPGFYSVQALGRTNPNLIVGNLALGRSFSVGLTSFTALDTSKDGLSKEYKYYFWMDAFKKDNTTFTLFIGEFPRVGTYMLDKDTKPTPAWLQFGKNYASYGGKGFYMTNSTNTGFITFTKVDWKLGHYAGTFGFRCKNETTGEVLEITEGRFDRDDS